MNNLRKINDYGQAIWLDYIERHLLQSGELMQLITTDGVSGITSNPAIFSKAISSDASYAKDLAIYQQQGLQTARIYECLAIPDIQAAADLLRPVYLDSARRNGYVSLEVSPLLAHDTAGTVAEAERLWREVNRANLMIKVPATAAGLPAITRLLAQGINVNVTLLFSVQTYRAVLLAWLQGLEQWVAQGGDAGQVASVASFFISRIDSDVDALLESMHDARADKLSGQAAIANARLAYQYYRQMVATARWQALAAQGGQTQRLLWASTGVKNPAYRDVLYIEELIGPDTVNTVPPATLAAFRSHGVARDRLTSATDPQLVLSEFAELGIDLEAVADRLLKQGLNAFGQAYAQMLQVIADSAPPSQGAQQ